MTKTARVTRSPRAIAPSTMPPSSKPTTTALIKLPLEPAARGWVPVECGADSGDGISATDGGSATSRDSTSSTRSTEGNSTASVGSGSSKTLAPSVAPPTSIWPTSAGSGRSGNVCSSESSRHRGAASVRLSQPSSASEPVSAGSSQTASSDSSSSSSNREVRSSKKVACSSSGASSDWSFGRWKGLSSSTAPPG